MDFENLKIEWLGHSGFLVAGSKRIVFDPFKLSKDIGKADFLFITHEHFDHCSLEDIEKVSDSRTVIFCAPECVGKLAKMRFKTIIPLGPEEYKKYEDIIVETVPAYNTNKFRSQGVTFHPKEDNKVGFIVELDGKRIYHAGDTDATEEILDLEEIDIAFVPVSGKYVMTASEAASAVNAFRPRLAIPMHYGEIVGNKTDAEKFKELCNVEVMIIEKS